jgi:adenosylhomocysteine nucleosidase
MIGIIGAMGQEVSFLCNVMGKYDYKKTGDFEFYTGKIEGKKCTVLRSGIGKVNAAVGCSMLIQQFKPGFIINTGSAGGFLPEQKVGDAIISTGLVYHDVDVTAFKYAPGQLPGQPAVFPVEERFVKIAEDAIDELKIEKILPGSFNHVRGIIGSGDTFVHQPQHIEALRRLFPDITAVEMEGAAIAHCCKLFSIPALVIRALSDIAGTESPISFEEFLPVAAKHSAEIVMRIVSKLG